MEAGMLGEYATGDDLLAAIGKLRALGYRQLDTFTPYPMHEAEVALGLRRSPLPWFLFPIACLGAVTGYILQYFTNAVNYPIDVGGRQLHAPLANIPITFELMVLFTGVSAFFAVFLISGLPRLHHPVADVEGFERATNDRFWVAVDFRDPAFDTTRTHDHLAETGPLRVVAFGLPAIEPEPGNEPEPGEGPGSGKEAT